MGHPSSGRQPSHPASSHLDPNSYVKGESRFAERKPPYRNTLRRQEGPFVKKISRVFLDVIDLDHVGVVWADDKCVPVGELINFAENWSLLLKVVPLEVENSMNPDSKYW